MEWYIKTVGAQKWANMNSSMCNLSTKAIVAIFNEHYECVTVVSDNEFFATAYGGRAIHVKRMLDVE